jgi:hypothetical protein
VLRVEKVFTWERLRDPNWDLVRGQVVASFKRRVWSRPSDGCWIWTGARNEDDYGQFNGPWLRELAHRLSYEMSVGLLGKDGVACHRCDTPPCVNPEHLFRGSSSLNSYDRHAKGRSQSSFEIRNSRRIRNMELISGARILRWTADLVASSPGSCKLGLSGERCYPRTCLRCRRRQQVIGLHMARGTLNESLDKRDPLYLLRLLTDMEREYVTEVAGE